MEFKRNKVFLGDVFNLIKVMPDESIDLVVTDPPYGDNVGYGRKGKTILNNEDESINYRFMEDIYPKMKDNTSLYLFTNHKFVWSLMDWIRKSEYKYRMLCVLVKNNIGMGMGFRNQHEFCLVLEKGRAEYNLKNVSNVWFMNHVEHDDQSHPHKKEDNIIRRIILHSSKPGDLVFDGFMGSFSTAVACYREGRDFIGTELDENWHALGEKKLWKEQSQLNMFSDQKEWHGDERLF